MEKYAWVEEFAGSVIVCDPDGIILEMNEKAVKSFQKRGGKQLLGSNLLHCHPEPARTRTLELYENRRPNHYTISKDGRRKIIHQFPWTRDGRFAGFVEISVPIPDALPHFDRD